jgi:hypothetical protein
VIRHCPTVLSTQQQSSLEDPDSTARDKALFTVCRIARAYPSVQIWTAAMAARPTLHLLPDPAAAANANSQDALLLATVHRLSASPATDYSCCCILPHIVHRPATAATAAD